MRMSLARRAGALSLALASGVTLVGFGSGALAGTSAASTAKASSGSGTITFALPPTVTPDYIFPFMTAQYLTNVNLYQFQQIMYRPLYWFGQGNSPTFNATLSMANAPVFSNGGKTVTITMKNYKWADGKPVTARDVIFWMNIVKAEKSVYPLYVPGEYPDNIVKMAAPSPTKVVFTLDKAYSSTWFLYNELSQITPLPQQAWDKESATGAVGNYDESPAGAAAVYKFLAQQSATPATYATNPLWKVVDGPFELKSFQTTGYSVFVPNPKYSGPVKAKYSQLIEQPFTTDSAEFSSLRAGTLDYGYIPTQDTSQIPLLKSQGYTSSPWIGWSINYFPMNYNNPKVGPIFKQLYFRQSVQYMVDQPTDVKKALFGYGYPTYGPVPIEPKNSLSTAQEASNPYPFNPKKSASLLKSHGWNVKPGGTTTCAKAGTGASDCGAGITKGEALSFNLQYASGQTYITQEMQQLKSNLAQVGVQLNLTSAPFNTVIANAAPCKVGPSCTWQMENWGQGWSYGPDYYPTGESIFATGSGINEGSYSNTVNDANINATHTVSGTKVLDTYENYLASQLPDVWQPNPDFQVSEIRNTLKGVVQSPLLNFTPEYWTTSK
ncbi:MAG: extracellular solute-binding protein family 5 [Acidimicrobiaceae bacterium]|jgi:peptide/nickel transport system substrate-binding protein|nr:extracellular solute-binding protein family 5 [Acidimicrobiaceae bacterium]